MPNASPRITYQNLNSMKANSSQRPGMIVQFQLLIDGAMSEVAGVFGLLAASRTKNNMCTFNGHVVTQKSWTGRYPKCQECGCEVTDAIQLRVTNPRLAGMSTAHLNREYWVA